MGDTHSAIVYNEYHNNNTTNNLKKFAQDWSENIQYVVCCLFMFWGKSHRLSKTCAQFESWRRTVLFCAAQRLCVVVDGGDDWSLKGRVEELPTSHLTTTYIYMLLNRNRGSMRRAHTREWTAKWTENPERFRYIIIWMECGFSGGKLLICSLGEKLQYLYCNNFFLLIAVGLLL